VTRPGEVVTVHKCDASGREVWTWPAVVQRVTPETVQVEARFNGPESEVQGVTFRPGDRFLETYHTRRWYNVFAVFEGETDQCKGWYCNITRPARFDAGHLHYDDLALDVLVLPDRSTYVLDEGEFESLPLSDEERLQARRAVEELRRLASEGQEPFTIDARQVPNE
jgi:protein associated with RNAse G/E